MVVQRYQALVCAIAYSGNGDLGRSEELAQETFIQARKTCGKSILFPSRQGPCDPQDEHPMP